MANVIVDFYTDVIFWTFDSKHDNWSALSSLIWNIRSL